MGEGWRKPWMRMREKSAMSDKGYVGTGRDRDDSSGLSETHMTLTSRHGTCFACSQSRSNAPRGAGLGQALVGSVPHTLFRLLRWPPLPGFRSSCFSSWASSLPLVSKPFVPLNPIFLPAQREYPGGLAKPHRIRIYLPVSPLSASQHRLVHLPAPTDGGATPSTSTPS